MTEMSFAQYEQAGWQRNAGCYDAIVAPATNQVLPGLLACLGDVAGCRVLELACGTGHLAARLAAAGARVVGLDVAANMLALARRQLGGRADFREGDAEALPFAAGEFDAVVCNFGFPHFADPDRALREVARVLRPGGILAFSVWQPPERGNAFFGLILGIYQQHANLQVGLPPAPPMFALADPAIHGAALERAGFGAVRAEDVAVAWPLHGPDTPFDFVCEGAVRTRMIYERQTPAAQDLIRTALQAATAERLRAGNRTMACPAVVVSARRSGGV